MEWWNALSSGKKYALVAAVVILVLLLGWWSLYKKPGVAPSGYNAGAGPSGAAGAAKPSGPVTRQAAPANVVVPNTTSTNVPANVAKPQLVAPAAPNSTANFRSFAITVSGNQFTPSTVIVKIGDTTHINFTAVDKDYDFTQPDYGFNVPLPKGQTKVVEFQGTAAGKFTFYCKSCGGPDKGPVGYIIVANQ